MADHEVVSVRFVVDDVDDVDTPVNSYLRHFGSSAGW